MFKYFKVASHVEGYSKFRPSPPEELIEKIIQFLGESNKGNNEKFGRAVDVGCGSGQSTEILQKYFNKVIGFDLSPEIIKEAELKNKFKNISYRTSEAEKVPIEDNSVDLVTTCQAAHWFNLQEFYKNTKRMLKNNGVLAIYGYSLPQPLGEKGPELTTLVEHYYKDVLKDYVCKESRWVYLDNYKNPEFNNVQFIENQKWLRHESIPVDITCSLSDLTGYITTWSGFQIYCEKTGDANGEKLVQKFQDDLFKILGSDQDEMINVRYNYFLLLGIKK